MPGEVKLLPCAHCGAEADPIHKYNGDDLHKIICSKCSMGTLWHNSIENAMSDWNRRTPELHALDEWHEDNGDVLWWRFPVVEPPYIGSPLDSKWPGNHTHWTSLSIPAPPEGMEGEA